MLDDTIDTFPGSVPMVHWDGMDSWDGVGTVGDIPCLSIHSHGMDSGDGAWLGRTVWFVLCLSIHSHGHQVQ